MIGLFSTRSHQFPLDRHDLLDQRDLLAAVLYRFFSDPEHLDHEPFESVYQCGYRIGIVCRLSLVSAHSSSVSSSSSSSAIFDRSRLSSGAVRPSSIFGAGFPYMSSYVFGRSLPSIL